MKKILVSMFLLLFGLILIGCAKPNVKITFNNSSIYKIVATEYNVQNGKKVSITLEDENQINYICNNFSSLELKSKGNKNEPISIKYNFVFYAHECEEKIIGITTNNLVSYNGHFHSIDQGEIDITYISSLFPKKDELIEFLITESIKEIRKLNELVIDNLDSDVVKNNIENIYNEYLDKVYTLTKVSDISKLNKEYKNQLYKQVPINKDKLNLSNLSVDEEKEVLNLLDEYLYRTNLIGIPLSKSYSLNLNSTTSKTWEYFFGENGIKAQTKKEDYWNVSVVLSNEYFLKGLNLCLDKSLFEDYENINITNEIDYSKYDYYNYNFENAKKYFNLAIKELMENNIYIPTDNNPVRLNIEIAYGDFTNTNKCEEIHYIIKNSIEKAFNSNEVGGSNFHLEVDFWEGEYFGQIYTEKLYNGKFDISFDKISGGGLDFNQYKEYLMRSSNSELSNNLTVNWSHDTGSIEYDCIIYNGYKYSYDDILLALQDN